MKKNGRIEATDNYTFKKVSNKERKKERKNEWMNEWKLLIEDNSWLK